MSETISNLPGAIAANLTDIVPATQGAAGPNSGTTRGVTVAQINALVTSPAPLTATMVAWFATLPTTAPGTPGQPWNNGGYLAFS